MSLLYKIYYSNPHSINQSTNKMYFYKEKELRLPTIAVESPTLDPPFACRSLSLQIGFSSLSFPSSLFYLFFQQASRLLSQLNVFSYSNLHSTNQITNRIFLYRYNLYTNIYSIKMHVIRIYMH